MSDWQPIDTAPEGTYILGWNRYGERANVSVDRFIWKEHETEHVVSDTKTRRVIEKGTRREREWEGEGWGYSAWMPLPDPPQNEERS